MVQCPEYHNPFETTLSNPFDRVVVVEKPIDSNPYDRVVVVDKPIDSNPYDRVDVVDKPIDRGTPYQVLFVTSKIGQRVSSSKLELKWRFGLADDKALHSGLTGMACCGEEHEVRVIWSVNSGKRQILVDGIEMHSSTRKVEAKFEASWNMCGYHEAKVIIIRSSGPTSRKLDFTLDGISFFDMPKISQLGSNSENIPATSPRESSPYSNECPNTTIATSRSRVPSFLSRKKSDTSANPKDEITRSRSCPPIAKYRNINPVQNWSFSASTKNSNSHYNDTTTTSESSTDTANCADSLSTSNSTHRSSFNGLQQRFKRLNISNSDRIDLDNYSDGFDLFKSLPAYAVFC